MSEVIRTTPSLKPIHQSKSPYFSRDISRFLTSSTRRASLAMNYRLVYSVKMHVIGARIRALTSHGEEGLSQGLDSLPLSVDLDPISSESQFDRVIAKAQQLEAPIVILWMASWCRKCIYLKPKLEKLAAYYHQRVRFYCVDVNNVSHKLVVRAEVTKMPTIQLWKDSKKQAEVIGGHKAYLVVNDIRDMVENEFTV